MFKLLSVHQSGAELKLQLPEGLGGSKNVRYYISHDANCIVSNGSSAASLPKQDTTVDWPFWVFTFVFNYL